MDPGFLDKAKAFTVVVAMASILGSTTTFANELAIQRLDGRGDSTSKIGGGVGTRRRKSDSAELDSVWAVPGLLDDTDGLDGEHQILLELPPDSDGLRGLDAQTLGELIHTMRMGVLEMGVDPFVSLDFRDTDAMVVTMHPVYRSTILGEVMPART